MRLRVSFDCSLGRHELDDYVRHLDVEVVCLDEACLNEYTVARLAMDQVLWSSAQYDEVSLFDICDSDSQGMHEMHVFLSGGGQQFRGDLEIEEVTDHVLFLHRAVFHTVTHPYRRAILDAAFQLFGQESLAVMWNTTGDLPEGELIELGFRRVAGRSLIYRHNALTTAFSEANPLGLAVDIDGEPEFEEWVDREWDKPDGG